MNSVVTHALTSIISIALAVVAIFLHLSMTRYRLADRVYVLEDLLRKLYDLDLIRTGKKGMYWREEVARVLADDEHKPSESLHESDNQSSDDTIPATSAVVKQTVKGQ